MQREMGGPDKSGLSFGTTYVLSAVSSVVAETVTFPVDMVKTRLQIQGEGGTAVKRGLVQTAVGIVKEEVDSTRTRTLTSRVASFLSPARVCCYRCHCCARREWLVCTRGLRPHACGTWSIRAAG